MGKVRLDTGEMFAFKPENLELQHQEQAHGPYPGMTGRKVVTIDIISDVF